MTGNVPTLSASTAAGDCASDLEIPATAATRLALYQREWTIAEESEILLLLTDIIPKSEVGIGRETESEIETLVCIGPIAEGEAGTEKEFGIETAGREIEIETGTGTETETMIIVLRFDGA
jgi:hypothetical protein